VTDKILAPQELVELTVISAPIQRALCGPLASLSWQHLKFTRIHPFLDLVKAGFNTLLIHKKWTWQGDLKFGGRCIHVSVIKTDSVFWKSSSQQARIW